MNDSDTKRISRLIAILTHLQTKKLFTSAAIAETFGVSKRTIFRDLKALEEAGVPIVTEEGKGFSLMEGYKIPPVMFSEQEASALITAEQLVLKNRDSSLIREYQNAVTKVKAVLGRPAKEKMELLSNRIALSPAIPKAIKSDSLSLIQQALTSFKVLRIVYEPEHNTRKTERRIEPFAFYFSLEGNWTLIAYCQLRKDYRMFRLDRIVTIDMLDATFKPHKLLLKDYLEEKEKNFKHP